MNSKTIYQEVILDHNRKPRNYGSLDQPSHHAVGHNPLCGDRIDLGLDMINNQINQIAFQGESCAICKASASMMTTAVKGKSPAEAKILIQEFRSMVMGTLNLS
ncbi:MAG TPA: SUF system NifU family Fe-S cluster assembly protein, partial [Nitrosomonas sp.]|nr:SUF system NifU family Fe-S cluster assembly protein [Nitrosomonas sp.]